MHDGGRAGKFTFQEFHGNRTITPDVRLTNAFMLLYQAKMTEM